MTDKPTMTAREVIELLDISAATLYSYVSRGIIRSEPAPGDSRQRRYAAEDVRRLHERKAQRRDPDRAAKGALRWGTPVLESALTLISDGRLYYRGHDAVWLAQTQPFEAVASLLWLNDPDGADRLFSGSMPEAPFAAWNALDGLSVIQRMQIAMTLASERELSAFDLRPENVARTGARILWLNAQAVLSQSITLGQPEAEAEANAQASAQASVQASVQASASAGIAHALCRRWNVADPQLISAALILCADHELNPSSFTARVVASAEANPYAVVLGGLAALQGFKHGGQTRRGRAFFREVEAVGSAREVIGERLQRGEVVPGFGHLLYPQGDPRARLILSLLENAHPHHPALRLANEVSAEVAGISGEAPNLDFGLVTLERVLALPQDSALALFALGRTVGWLAHAMEQFATGTLIRPRAEYNGPRPTARE